MVGTTGSNFVWQHGPKPCNVSPNRGLELLIAGNSKAAVWFVQTTDSKTSDINEVYTINSLTISGIGTHQRKRRVLKLNCAFLFSEDPLKPSVAMTRKSSVRCKAYFLTELGLQAVDGCGQLQIRLQFNKDVTGVANSAESVRVTGGTITAVGSASSTVYDISITVTVAG